MTYDWIRAKFYTGRAFLRDELAQGRFSQAEYDQFCVDQDTEIARLIEVRREDVRRYQAKSRAEAQEAGLQARPRGRPRMYATPGEAQREAVRRYRARQRDVKALL